MEHTYINSFAKRASSKSRKPHMNVSKRNGVITNIIAQQKIRFELLINE